MLKTCTRCRTRRIKCDARLPACQNCHKTGLSCSFFDDVLQQDVPRSHIKSLYDRIEELKAIVAVHHTHTQSSDDTASSSPTEAGGTFQVFLPCRNGTQFLENSPPVIIGDTTVRKLLEQGVRIESPFLIPGNLNPEDEGVNLAAASRFDRGSVTPSTVRLLLAHYVRCIEPALPAGIAFPDENEASLKQMEEASRCCVLLACAIAATHKSYYNPAWKIVATTCREWGGELAAQIVTRPNDRTIIILLLLIIYELADSERGLIWELLSFATRSCLELGWHRTDEQDVHHFPGPTINECYQTRRLPPETKKQTLSVLIHIDRMMNILVHRTSILSCSIPWNQADSDVAYNHCTKLMQQLFEPAVSAEASVGCPLRTSLPQAMETLQRMPPSEILTHLGWTLLLPALVNHSPCEVCTSFSTMARSKTYPSLQARVLSEAACLVDAAHAILSSRGVFIPPVLATCRAFIGGCVFATGISSHWPTADAYSTYLLKCSEVLAFTLSLWRGGKDYYDTWRQISRAV